MGYSIASWSLIHFLDYQPNIHAKSRPCHLTNTSGNLIMDFVIQLSYWFLPPMLGSVSEVLNIPLATPLQEMLNISWFPLKSNCVVMLSLT